MERDPAALLLAADLCLDLPPATSASCTWGR